MSRLKRGASSVFTSSHKESILVDECSIQRQGTQESEHTVQLHVQLMCTTHASILHQVCGLQGLCGHSHVLELKDRMAR